MQNELGGGFVGNCVDDGGEEEDIVVDVCSVLFKWSFVAAAFYACVEPLAVRL